MANNNDIQLKVHREVWNVIANYYHPDEYTTWGLSENDVAKIALQAFENIFADLKAYVQRDPAIHGRADVALAASNEIKAIIHYRIANASYYYEDLDAMVRQLTSEKIHHAAKAETKVDIHPAARIGKRFVLDHGVGTVIGETCQIGDDCYILQGVILGATGIADNPNQKRHPTIGNNVEIGAFVRILGPVVIDDNIVISPYCVITHDVINSGKPIIKKILIVNQLQLSRPPMERQIDIYGVVPGKKNTLTIYGNNFVEPAVDFVDSSGRLFKDLSATIAENEDDRLSVSISYKGTLAIKERSFDGIRIRIKDGAEILYVTESQGMKRLLAELD